MQKLLSDHHYELSEDELNQVMELTDGYSGADMANLCREAALCPIRALKVAGFIVT